MRTNKFQMAVLIGACFVTMFLRARDTPIRVDSMIALALLCGAVVRHPVAILLPLFIRLLTDTLLWYQTGYGFYSSILFDYSAYLLIVLLARYVPLPRYVNVVAGGLIGPLLFFVLSNLGVWYMWPGTYPQTPAGLLNCYAKGLPFLQSSVAGNFLFALIFLGAWHAATVLAGAQSFTAVRKDRVNEG